MATVTGTINGPDGTKDVALNNAATESTLKALLSVANVDSALLKAMAANAGIDQATLDALEAQAVQTADNLATTSVSSTKLTTAQNNLTFATNLANVSFYGLIASTHQLASGQATMSGILSNFSNLPGPLGDVIKGFASLASFQEANMKSYQDMSASGVSFGGDLTKMRMAAQNSYMSLTEFSGLIKNNSQALTMLGGSANAGAVEFAKFSHSMLSSEVGTQLLALGYTAEEANQSMITYLAASGVSNAKDLESNKALRQGAAEYLEELDRLADVTGKSRKEQDDIMKKQKLDAEIQMTAARMAPEQRAAFEENVKYMTMMYGDAGKDMALAQAQHRSVITKEGQTLTAIAPGMQQAYQKMVDAGNKFGVGSKQYIDAQNEMSLAAQKGMNSIPLAAYSANDSLKSLSQAQLTVANQEKAGLTSKEAFNARDKKIEDEKAARAVSQAKVMAETDKNLKEMGQSIMMLVTPIVSLLTPVIGFLADHMKLLGTLMAAYIGYQLIINREKAKEAASGLASSVLDKIKNPLGGGGAGGALNGVSKVAEAGGTVGGSSGGGLVSFIRSLGRGLASLAPIAVPMLIGAGALAGVIAILGAGIAAAVALVGLSLPIFAKGLKDFVDLDGSSLSKVAQGIAALGGAIAIFGTASVAGGLSAAFSNVVGLFTGGGVIGQIKTTVAELTPILPQLSALGPAINTYAQGIMAFGRAVNTVDIAKAEKLKSVLSGPTPAEALQNAGAQMIQAATKFVTGGNGAEEKTHSEMQALNNTMKDILRYIKDTAENTKRTHDATKALNGNLFAV